MMFLPLYCFI